MKKTNNNNTQLSKGKIVERKKKTIEEAYLMQFNARTFFVSIHLTMKPKRNNNSNRIANNRHENNKRMI